MTNCFCIPHKEYEERVEADIVYAQDMYELNRKVPLSSRILELYFVFYQVAPHESLVGWFATGNEITSHSALIHDYYARCVATLGSGFFYHFFLQGDQRPNSPDFGHNTSVWASDHEGLCFRPPWCAGRHFWLHVHPSSSRAGCSRT